MNPFEEFLRRLFGGGPPPTAMEEERQAANMGQAARDLPGMARSIGKSFLDAYKQRAVDLQDLAMQNPIAGGGLPLSDMGGQADPRLAQAQRDLALDVLSAGAFGGASQMGGALLSSAPGVGQSTARNAALDRLAQSRIFQVSPDTKFSGDSWRQYGNTLEEARANLSAALARRQLNPEIAAVEQIPVGHSSPFFYEVPEITRRTMETGEGASLKGPGLYVADAPAVYDGHYRNTLARFTGAPTVLGGLPLDYKNLDYLWWSGEPGQPSRARLEQLRKTMQQDYNTQIRFAASGDRTSDLARARAWLEKGAKNRDRKQSSIVAIKVAEKSPDEAFQLWKNKIAHPGELESDYVNARYANSPGDLMEQNEKYARKNFEAFVEYYKSRSNELQEDAKRATASYKRDLARYNEAVSGGQRPLNISYPPRIVATYEGLLGANPNELLQLDRPFFGLEGADLQKVMDVFRNFRSPVTSGSSFIRGGRRVPLDREYLKNMEQAVAGLPQLSPMTLAEWQTSGNRANRDLLREASHNVANINVNALKGYAPSAQYTALANEPFDILDALRDQGMVGTKYADAASRRNFLAPIVDPEETTFNYTVYDPRRIQFNRAYAAADPFGSLSTVMQAMRNEKEKKKK